VVGYNDGTFSLVDVVSGTIPPGQQQSGPPTYSISGGIVTETIPTQPIPPRQVAQINYNNAINAGLTLTWTTSTTLNGTYAIDPQATHNVNLVWTFVLANNAFPGGRTRQHLTLLDGTTQIQMSITQFPLYAAPIMKYLDDLDIARLAQAAGGSPTWPSNSVSITG
jgi:hypothetical protein